jgi:hypothetical protein
MHDRIIIKPSSVWRTDKLNKSRFVAHLIAFACSTTIADNEDLSSKFIRPMLLGPILMTSLWLRLESSRCS